MVSTTFRTPDGAHKVTISGVWWFYAGDNPEFMGVPSTENWAVVVGNPVDGLSLHGPFPSLEKANDYTDSISDTEYWVTKMVEPEQR